MKNEQLVTEENIAVTSAPFSKVKNEGLAAILSLLVPGAGQFYNGHYLWAIFWIIVTPGLWIGSAGTMGFVLHIMAAIHAYRQSIQKNYEQNSIAI